MTALTGAQRLERTTARLAEARQHVATIAQELADHQKQYQVQAVMVTSVQRDVVAARNAVKDAEEALAKAQASALDAEGTDDESAAQANYDQAITELASAKDKLAKAVAAEQVASQKLADEGKSVQAKMAETTERHQAALRLVNALQARHKDASEQAGREWAAERAQKIATAALTLLDEICKGGPEHYGGQYLPQVLAEANYTWRAIDGALTGRGNALHVMRQKLEGVLVAANSQLGVESK